MTDREILKPWVPLPGLPEVLFCERFEDGEAGVRIELAPRDARSPLIRLSFASVIAYQNVNETYRYRTWQQAGGGHPTLLTVEGSSWLSWLKQESGGLLDDVPLVHYAIYTSEDCIDVVSRTAPIVEIIARSMP